MRKNLLIVVFVAVLPFAAVASDTLDVYFIDVGQGDAILIDCGDWEALLDAGPGTKESNQELMSVLARCVQDDIIELSILSHPHADHYGGFVPVFDRYEIWEFWSSHDDAPDNSGPTYLRFLSLIASEGIVPKQLERGDRSVMGLLEWLVLGPGDPMVGGTNDNENSLVLLLTYGDVHFLFTGDIGKYGEAALADIELPDSRIILKVAHHGSEHSSIAPFIRDLDPEVSVISAGETKSYGHPNAEVLQRLAETSDVYLTTLGNKNGCLRDGSFSSEDYPSVHVDVGTITVETDGECIWVITDLLGKQAVECSTD